MLSPRTFVVVLAIVSALGLMLVQSFPGLGAWVVSMMPEAILLLVLFGIPAATAFYVLWRAIKETWSCDLAGPLDGIWWVPDDSPLPRVDERARSFGPPPDARLKPAGQAKGFDGLAKPGGAQVESYPLRVGGALGGLFVAFRRGVIVAARESGVCLPCQGFPIERGRRR